MSPFTSSPMNSITYNAHDSLLAYDLASINLGIVLELVISPTGCLGLGSQVGRIRDLHGLSHGLLIADISCLLEPNLVPKVMHRM